MNKTIIIAGDSWGCGELGGLYDGEKQILHAGLSQHFLDSGYQVSNLSRIGGSNTESAGRIEDYLRVNKHQNIVCCIVFQTEWIRGLSAEDPEILADDLKHGYQGLKDRRMSRFYFYLSRCAIRRNVPIFIVGGCGDTIWIDNFENEYPGLHIACQSFTNLLIHNNHRISDPVHATFTKLKEFEVTKIKPLLSNNDLELLVKDMDQGIQRQELWKSNKKYFWPDDHHANRYSHQILFDFIKKQIA